MKPTTTTFVIGLIVGLLGLLGLISGETQLGDSMNVDIALDIIRIALGAYLIYSSRKSLPAMRTALNVFGIAYLAMFVLGVISPSLFGIAPHQLGWMDQTLHLVGGAAGLLLGMASPRNRAAY
jgi:hypothetical protein